MDIKISLICPVFNGEKHLQETLSNILEILPIDAQLIIVNDGSTDDTEQICQDFIRKFPEKNVVYIVQENQGVSSARNAGINAANTEYIAFVDADDLLADNYFNCLFKLIKNKPDIAAFEFTYDRNLLSLDDDIDNIQTSKQQILEYKFFESFNWQSFIAIYKRDLFSDCLFEENINFIEDIDCISTLFLKAQEIIYINKNLYFYKMHQDSATFYQNFTEDKDKSIQKVLQKLFDKANSEEQNRDFLIALIIKTYNLYRNIYKKQKSSLNYEIDFIEFMYKLSNVVNWSDCFNTSFGKVLRIKFFITDMILDQLFTYIRNFVSKIIDK